MQVLGTWARIRGHRPLLISGISSAAILGAVFVAVESYNLIGTPFPPTANAYASIFYTLNGFLLLMVFTGIALQAGTLVRLFQFGEPLDMPRLRLWLQNSELFWFFTLASVAIGFMTTYLVPHIL